MTDEPPSTSAEPQRLGITKKVHEKVRRIYQKFSYKPKSKQEIAGSIRDSSDRGVLEKGTLSMMEGALKFQLLLLERLWCQGLILFL